MRKKWFDGLQTKEQMNSLVIGEIEAIMGDLSTNADSEVLKVARSLDRLNKAWDAKKALLQAEPEEKFIHHHCNVDIQKVQSLLDFPLIERGPMCKICDCFNCNKLPDCNIKFPTTLQFCEKKCAGKIGIVFCEYKGKKPVKWTLEEIMRNEG